MISASHNPIADNGIKFFGPDGFKLSDDLEDRIEALLDSPELPRPSGTAVGIAQVAQNLGRHYYAELYEGAPNLAGLHVVVDGAFGAAYAIAPYALRKLGARRHRAQLRKRRRAHQRRVRRDRSCAECRRPFVPANRGR